MSIHIESERLILRQFTPSDAKAVCYNSKQPIVALYKNISFFKIFLTILIFWGILL